jgi:hypothetical protein
MSRAERSPSPCSLFADAAVYVEPFTPGGGKHVGRATIGR